MKGKGFRRLTAVQVSDSGTDDEFQPLNNSKRSSSFSCCKLCWHGTVALALLALCAAAALGGYSLYGMQLEMSSLREEVEKLRGQGSTDYAELSLLHNRTSTDLQQLQSAVNQLLVVAAVRGGNSSALNNIRQQLHNIVDTLEGSFASDIRQLSHKVLNLSTEMSSAMTSAQEAQNSSATCLAALRERHRLEGDLKSDVYLLKRANKTLMMQVDQIRSDIRVLNHSWSTASGSLNSSLLALQLALDTQGPCTNCCHCDHHPPSAPAKLLSAPYMSSPPEWAMTGSTTPPLPTMSAPAIHPSKSSSPPPVKTYSFAVTSEVPVLWANTNTPIPTATSHSLQPTVETSSHTLQTTVEMSSHSLQPTVETSSHTLQPTVETSSHMLQTTVEMSSHSLQPTVETSSHTLQPTVETSSHMLQTTVEMSSHSLQPTVETSSHSLQTGVETSSHSLQPTVETSSHSLQPTVDTSSHSLQTGVDTSSHSLQTGLDTSSHSLQTGVDTSSHSLQPTVETSSHSLQPTVETSSHSLQTGVDTSSHSLQTGVNTSSHSLQTGVDTSSHSLQPTVEATPPGRTENWPKLMAVIESIRDSFDVTDVDSDGKLSMSEFSNLPQDVPKSKFFTIFDLNNNSFVDMAELQTVLTHIRNKISASPSPSPSPPPL